MNGEREGAWRLIAVLQSTLWLPPVLGLRLYRTAVSLHRTDSDAEELTDETVARGVVRRLGRELLLGTFGGPGFEAELETPHGKGFVRFIVTQEGLDHAAQEDDRLRRWQRAHWN